MKKTISVILCLLIAAISLVSCSSKKNEENNATLWDSFYYTYDSAYSYDDATIRAYEDLCKAIVNGSDEVRMNSAYFDDVMALYNTSFPLSAIVESIEQSESVYKIKYKYEDAHGKAYEFVEKADEIQGACNNEFNNDNLRAVKLYNYIASSIKVSDNSAITCYETIMTGEGTTFSYSKMFAYLLQQMGIKSYYVLCEDETGAAKAMVMAELNEELYYFDVFKEFEDNEGKNLKYFGMTSEDIKAYGIKNAVFLNSQPASDASALKFEALRNCKKWELDEENLLITKQDDEIVQIAL